MGRTIKHAIRISEYLQCFRFTRIDFDYEYLTARMRVLLCIITGLVTGFSVTVMIVLLCTADPSTLRWAVYNGPSFSSSSSSSSYAARIFKTSRMLLGNYFTDDCDALVEVDEVLVIVNGCVIAGVMLLYSLTFLFFGLRLFAATVDRKHWSVAQKLKVRN